jgi:hypothetical protein
MFVFSVDDVVFVDNVGSPEHRITQGSIARCSIASPPRLPRRPRALDGAMEMRQCVVSAHPRRNQF